MSDLRAPAVSGAVTTPGPGIEPWPRALAAVTLVFTLGAAAVVLALATTMPADRAAELNSPVAVALQMIGMTGLALAGAALARAQPKAPMAWLMLAVAGAWASVPLSFFVALVLNDGGHPLAPSVGWVTNWIWVPAQALTMLMLLRFPTGRLPGPRWKVAEWAVLVWAGVAALTTALLPGPIGAGPLEPLTNPIGVPALADVGDSLLSGLFIVLPGLIVVACASPISRWRNGDRSERRALRWLALAAAVVALSAPLAILSEEGQVLQGAAFLLLPIAVGTAVVREQLWDLDLRLRYDRLQAARREERERLRRELHDSLGPVLGSVSMRAEAARNLLALGDATRVDELLTSIGASTELALGEVRRLIDELGPSVLEGSELSIALNEHVEAYSDHFPVTVVAHPDPLPELDPGMATTAFLVIAEAVRNAARHSGGTRATVTLNLLDQRLGVEVTDDGRGLRNARAGVGRVGMERRVSDAGGRFWIEDASAGGTVVRFELPGALR